MVGALLSTVTEMAGEVNGLPDVVRGDDPQVVGALSQRRGVPARCVRRRRVRGTDVQPGSTRVGLVLELCVRTPVPASAELEVTLTVPDVVAVGGAVMMPVGGLLSTVTVRVVEGWCSRRCRLRSGAGRSRRRRPRSCPTRGVYGLDRVDRDGRPRAARGRLVLEVGRGDRRRARRAGGTGDGDRSLDVRCPKSAR